MVVDASALLAIVLREGDQETLARTLYDHRNDLHLSPVNHWEVHTRVNRLADENVDSRWQATLQMFDFKIGVIGRQILELAVEAQRKFGRGNHEADLNMGDCFAYALAKSRDDMLLFKGDDFSKTDVRIALV